MAPRAKYEVRYSLAEGAKPFAAPFTIRKEADRFAESIRARGLAPEIVLLSSGAGAAPCGKSAKVCKPSAKMPHAEKVCKPSAKMPKGETIGLGL